MDAAAQAKEKGNAAFKSGAYAAALQHYTTAISLKADEPTFYLNRAAVYIKLARWNEAEVDATKTIELAPKNTKALFRRAVARRELGELAGARQDLKSAKEHGGGPEVDRELELLLATAKAARLKAEELAPGPEAVSPILPPVLSSRAPAPAAEPTTESPTISRLRAAIAPSTNAPKAPANEFLKEVSTRRTASFADKKADRESRLPPRPPAPSPPPERLPTPALATKAVAAPPYLNDQDSAAAVPSALPTFLSTAALAHTPVPEHPPPITPTTAKSTLTSTWEALAAPAAFLPNSLSSPSKLRITSASFETAWSSCTSSEERRALLIRLDITRLPQIFGDRLEPDLFSEIVEALVSGDGDWLERLRLLEALPKVRRFSTAVAFLEEREKDGLRALMEKVRHEVDNVAVAWEM